MGPSIERVKNARKDVVDALAAIEGEDIDVSLEGRGLVRELLELEDSAWGELLANFEGDELHGLLTRLRTALSDVRERRDRFFSPILQIGHRAFFDFPMEWLVIEMRFVKSRGESLEARHDLEDTLRIGASVIALVADVMGSMDVLSEETKRRCIGSNFEKNLNEAAEKLEEIKQIFNSIHGR